MSVSELITEEDANTPRYAALMGNLEVEPAKKKTPVYFTFQSTIHAEKC